MLATLCCHVRASSCSSFSGCEARALALTGFNTCGSRLQSTGSTAVAHGLSCSAARGIVPDQVSNPRLLHLQVASLPLSHQGSLQKLILKTLCRDVPGGPVVKNPPSNSGDLGLMPGLGTKILHAAEQLMCHVHD